MEGSCSPPHGGDCTAGMATECHRNTALTVGVFWHHSSTRRRVHTKAKTAVRLVEHGRGRRRLLPAVHASICAGLQDFSPFWPVLDNKRSQIFHKQTMLAYTGGIFQLGAECWPTSNSPIHSKNHTYSYIQLPGRAARTPQQNRSADDAVRQKEEKGEIVG